jgi:hypothetical protein
MNASNSDEKSEFNHLAKRTTSTSPVNQKKPKKKAKTSAFILGHSRDEMSRVCLLGYN